MRISDWSSDVCSSDLFCAGGDVRMLAESGAVDGAEARAFFHEEYRLNHLLFTYAKPVVAFMDGITMGGGVRLSQPAKYSIATVNNHLATTEPPIVLITDVAGRWLMSLRTDGTGSVLPAVS